MALKRTKRLIATFSLIFTIGAFLCLTIAFATPHWLERFPHKRMTKVFVRMGLWEVCFNDWTFYKDYLGKSYNGCWWIFHYEYRPVLNWLDPPWLMAIQVLITVAFIIHMVTVVLNIMYYVRLFSMAREKKMVLITTILMGLAALLISISTTIFGIKADTDRQWLPNPDSNFLSWSFGLAVLSGFFSIFSTMCLIGDFLRIRDEEERAKRGPEYAVKPNQRM